MVIVLLWEAQCKDCRLRCLPPLSAMLLGCAGHAAAHYAITNNRLWRAGRYRAGEGGITGSNPVLQADTPPPPPTLQPSKDLSYCENVVEWMILNVFRKIWHCTLHLPCWMSPRLRLTMGIQMLTSALPTPSTIPRSQGGFHLVHEEEAQKSYSHSELYHSLLKLFLDMDTNHQQGRAGQQGFVRSWRMEKCL